MCREGCIVCEVSKERRHCPKRRRRSQARQGFAIEATSVRDLADVIESRGLCGKLCGHVHSGEYVEVCVLKAKHQMDQGWMQWGGVTKVLEALHE